MPSPPPSPDFSAAGSGALPRWRWFVLGALVLVLWPALMIFPGTPEGYLDDSWQLVLIHAHAHGWQFGRDLVFTWGPWGFLSSHYHLGETGAVAKLVWETLGRLLLAASLVFLTRSLAGWRQGLFVVGLALIGWLFVDAVFYLAIGLMVAAGLMRPAAGLAERALWGLALGFLSCFKFTYPVVAGAGVALATAACLLRGDRRGALTAAGAYVLGLVLAWVAAGQHPDHLWPYFVRSLEITSGYGDAMGADESLAVFAWGAGLLVAGWIYLAVFVRRHPDRISAWSMGLFFAGLWFVVWKSSFTRADGHVFGFFIFAGLAGLVLPGLCEGFRRPHWLDLSVLAALGGIATFEAGLIERIPAVGVARIRENYAALPKIPRMPRGWELAWQEASARHRLPQIQAVVGRGTVDVVNFEQAIALFNGFNFTPRPVFQSYSAYTPRLAWRNLRFYRTPATAPDYVLWKHATIDGRFPSLDDAGLVAEIGRGYEPVLEEKGFLLLRKRTALPPVPLTRRLVFEQGVAFDQEVPLPAAGSHPRWLQIELPLTKLGRLRALLYKPPMAFLVTKDAAGAERTWRLLPRVAADGFLFDPVLETQPDFAAYMRGKGNLAVRSIRLTTFPAQREYFSTIWRRPTVRVFELPEIALRPQGRYAALVQAGIFGVEPESIDSPHALVTYPTAAGPVVQVHTPGEVRFLVPTGAREFVGHFGLRDGAHTSSAPTDGVLFRLEAQQADGTRALLWERKLDPARTPADRGPQSFRVALPAGYGLQVFLQALPDGTDESDWSYFGGLHFEPAPSP